MPLLRGEAAEALPALLNLVDLELNGALASGVQQAPLENQIGAGTTGFLRWVRTHVRRLVKVIRHAAARWVDWLGGLILFAVVAVLAAVVDREVLETGQRDGAGALARALALGSAVYLRLLVDGRIPVAPKLLLVFAIAYGAAAGDLIPDNHTLKGFIDDLMLIFLSSRVFMLACPDWVVEEQARAAAIGRARVEPN